jgi:DNA-binding LytR/AlgR family response regulator
MGGMNGISFKDKVETNSGVWRIVFVTSHDEMMKGSFGLKIIGFESKPIAYDTVAGWIAKVKGSVLSDRCISLDLIGGDKDIRVRIEDIFYIQACGNYAELYCYMNNTFKTCLLSSQLGSIEEKLKEYDIIRVHKSYMVNIANVTRVGDEITMRLLPQGVPCGRKYKGDVTRQYKEFARRKVLERL